MQKLVMVVDDSVTVRAIADLVFRKTEFHLVTASSAVEAVSCLPNMRPEMFIIDAEMPSVDGYTLARRLKATDATADIPILLMVTDAGPDPERLGDADIDGYIIKPFTSSEMLDPVRMLTGVDVRADVPLSFEQIVAARRAAEEQRRAELEAMMVAKKKSEEDELNFEMDDGGFARPIASRPIPPPPPPPPESTSAPDAAADLDLPPARVTEPEVEDDESPTEYGSEYGAEYGSHAEPDDEAEEGSADDSEPEVNMEAPISARTNRPIEPGIPLTPSRGVPIGIPLGTPVGGSFGGGLSAPIGGPIGDPEPVEEPEQHVISQSIEPFRRIVEKPPLPVAPRKKPETPEIVVEHVAQKVREPEMRRPPEYARRKITRPPEPQWPNRRLLAVIIAAALIGVAIVVWLRS